LGIRRGESNQDTVPIRKESCIACQRQLQGCFNCRIFFSKPKQFVIVLVLGYIKIVATMNLFKLILKEKPDPVTKVSQEKKKDFFDSLNVTALLLVITFVGYIIFVINTTVDSNFLFHLLIFIGLPEVLIGFVLGLILGPQTIGAGGAFAFLSVLMSFALILTPLYLMAINYFSMRLAARIFSTEKRSTKLTFIATVWTIIVIGVFLSTL
jgi:hypothetical protein